jgi:hypothetical protein
VSLDVDADGVYSLAFRYAMGEGENRQLKIQVDGKVVKSKLSFPPTGSWSTWKMTNNVSVSLTAGSHTVVARTRGLSGANIDSLVVRLETVDLPEVPTLMGIDHNANSASTQASVRSGRVSRMPLHEEYVNLVEVFMVKADGSQQDITSEVSLVLTQNAGVAALGRQRDSCEAQFGSALDFLLCEEQWDTYRFNARTDGGTCDEVCNSFGTVCVDAIANGAVTCVANLPTLDTCAPHRERGGARSTP